MVIQAIHQLLAKGLSEQDIGDRVGASQPSINRIKLGKQKPGYEIGRAIVELRDTVIGEGAPEPTVTTSTANADRRHLSPGETPAVRKVDLPVFTSDPTPTAVAFPDRRKGAA